MSQGDFDTTSGIPVKHSTIEAALLYHTNIIAVYNRNAWEPSKNGRTLFIFTLASGITES